MDAAVINQYHEWRSKYLILDVLANIHEAYIKADKKKEEVVSEGQGYGMVILALMAGVDNDEQQVYNKLYNYYKDHCCTKVAGHSIMVWKQYNGENADNDGAADGDLDIAYSLLLADKQWGSDGEIKYKQEAINLLKDILNYYVNPDAGIILNSNSVKSEDKKTQGFAQWEATRVSDFMPAHLRAFDKALPDILWNKVINNTYKIFLNYQDAVSKSAFIPDVIVDVVHNPQPAPSHYLRGEKKIDLGTYNYNACRIPWRIGTDFLLDSTNESYSFLQKLNKQFHTITNDDPLCIADGYSLQGVSLHKKPDKYHLCYVAPLGVSAMIDNTESGKEWLTKIWSYINSVKVDDYNQDDDFGYYDNTIKLYSMIIMSGHYWRVKY